MSDQLLDVWMNSGAFWQMSQAERCACAFLMSRVWPRQIAIEVGTYCGGFLRAAQLRFRRLYSLDVDHSRVRPEDFKDVYDHCPIAGDVQFITGQSSETLPALLAQLADDELAVSLVLIDADHSFDAVLRDINTVLTYKPREQLLLLMHDSWDRQVRAAIGQAAWSASPYVQLVEKDFVPGDVGADGVTMVGGLALAVLIPQERQGDAPIRQSHERLYQACLRGLR